MTGKRNPPNQRTASLQPRATHVSPRTESLEAERAHPSTPSSDTPTPYFRFGAHAAQRPANSNPHGHQRSTTSPMGRCGPSPALATSPPSPPGSIVSPGGLRGSTRPAPPSRVRVSTTAPRQQSSTTVRAGSLRGGRGSGSLRGRSGPSAKQRGRPRKTSGTGFCAGDGSLRGGRGSGSLRERSGSSAKQRGRPRKASGTGFFAADAGSATGDVVDLFALGSPGAPCRSPKQSGASVRAERTENMKAARQASDARHRAHQQAASDRRFVISILPSS